MAEDEGILGMTPEERMAMINPLTAGDLQTLREVDAIAEAARTLMSRAEMAGLDMSAQRTAIDDAQQKARGILAAFRLETE